jgi:hypothetical protein
MGEINSMYTQRKFNMTKEEIDKIDDPKKMAEQMEKIDAANEKISQFETSQEASKNESAGQEKAMWAVVKKIYEDIDNLDAELLRDKNLNEGLKEAILKNITEQESVAQATKNAEALSELDSLKSKVSGIAKRAELVQKNAA